MHHSRGKGGTGSSEYFLRNAIFLGQCLIGGIGYRIDFQQRNVTFPNYESPVDLLITRKRTRVVPGSFRTKDVAVVGWSGTVVVITAAAVAAVLGTPGRQAINSYNVFLRQLGLDDSSTAIGKRRKQKIYWVRKQPEELSRCV